MSRRWSTARADSGGTPRSSVSEVVALLQIDRKGGAPELYAIDPRRPTSCWAFGLIASDSQTARSSISREGCCESPSG